MILKAARALPLLLTAIIRMEQVALTSQTILSAEGFTRKKNVVVHILPDNSL